MKKCGVFSIVAASVFMSHTAFAVVESGIDLNFATTVDQVCGVESTAGSTKGFVTFTDDDQSSLPGTLSQFQVKTNGGSTSAKIDVTAINATGGGFNGSEVIKVALADTAPADLNTATLHGEGESFSISSGVDSGVTMYAYADVTNQASTDYDATGGEATVEAALTITCL